ncbi:transmembrane and coiled-coil domains-containing protein 7 [Quaeritorhiza haematococci]|nr:transmembrane and coiled-coil domains-containing protein 7 [Quaeritorhiza haematococci]
MPVNPPRLDQYEKVSKLLLATPWQVNSLEEYCAVLCPQMIEILTSDEDDSYMHRAVAFVAVRFVEKYPQLAREYFGRPMLQALLSFHNFQLRVARSEKVALDVHGRRIVACETELSKALRALTRFFVSPTASEAVMKFLMPAIPALYYILQFSATTPSLVKQTVHDILKTYISMANTKDALDALRWITITIPETQRIAAVSMGSTGGIILVESSEPQRPNPEILIELVAESQNKALLGEFFVEVLDYYEFRSSNIGTEETERDERILSLLQVLMELMKRCESVISENTSQVLSFVKILILQGERHLEDNEQSMLFMSFALLQNLFSPDIQWDSGSRLVVDEIIAALRRISASHVEEVRDSAKETLEVLLTSKRTGDTDSLLPIRAHGLNTIRKLVLARDAVVLAKLDMIVFTYLEFLKEEDRGLSALSDAYPKQTMSKLMEHYGSPADMDFRLRIGEAVLQTIQRCGEVFGKYASDILPTILAVLHEERVELRSSALSLLACVAETSPWSLAHQLYQIMDYLHYALALEKQVEIRRGAIVVFLQLIRGFSTSTIAAVPADVLTQILRDLRYVESTDADELTRCHARTALLDLDAAIGAGLNGA